MAENVIFLILNNDYCYEIDDKDIKYPKGLKGQLIDVSIFINRDNRPDILFKLQFENPQKYPTSWFNIWEVQNEKE